MEGLATKLFGSFGSQALRDEVAALKQEVARLTLAMETTQQISWAGKLCGTASKGLQSAVSAVNWRGVVGNLDRIAVTAGIVGYLIYKSNKSGWIRRPRTIQAVEAVEATASSGDIINESVRAESEEFCAVPPKCQASVGYMEQGVFKVLGCGVRMQTLEGQSYFLVPEHVVAPLINRRQGVWLRAHTDAVVEIPLRRLADAVTLAVDMVAFSLTADESSSIGLAVAKLGSLIEGPVGEYVQIVNGTGKGSKMSLRHSQNFGYVEYSGTTRPGYSGAAYMRGKHLIGLHVSGGKINLGYSAQYLWVLLKSELGLKNEDSADWLRDLRKHGKSIHFGRFHEDGDVVIRAQGMYHRVSKRALTDALGRDWEMLEYDDQPTDLNMEPEADFPVSPSTSGASDTAVKDSLAVAQANLQQTLAQCEQLNSQQEKILKLRAILSLPKKSLSGQTLAELRKLVA